MLRRKKEGRRDEEEREKRGRSQQDKGERM